MSSYGNLSNHRRQNQYTDESNVDLYDDEYSSLNQCSDKNTDMPTQLTFNILHVTKIS